MLYTLAWEITEAGLEIYRDQVDFEGRRYLHSLKKSVGRPARGVSPRKQANMKENKITSRNNWTENNGTEPDEED